MIGLGVLEYFTQDQLSALLKEISSQHAPAVALSIEPIAAGADLENFDASFVAGEEHSFTHNYPLRLTEANWEILKVEEVKLQDYRWLVIMAAC